MYLVMTLLVRDEIDLIEHNIKYHLAQGVDYFIVTDNGSTDGTRDVLDTFRKAGILEVFDEPDQQYQQGAWVTRMALRAHDTLRADWIINSDADEFWWPENGTLKDSFAGLEAHYGRLIADRTNFLPSVQFTRPFWKHMIYRELSSKILSGGGNIWPKMAHRGSADVLVSRGNHDVRGATLGPASPARPIIIFHFPHLYFERLEQRIRLFGASLALNSDLRFMPWTKLHELYQRGELDDWYDRLPKIETHIATLMRQGTVTRDTRLRSFFENRALLSPSI